MKIREREIGPGHPPYIIAEISCNHGGSLPRALELIACAKALRADAVKFQCVTADTITIDCDRPEFTIEDGPWKGQNLHQLYKRTETPFEWFPEIKKRADMVGITWFASVFDKTAVDLMVSLGAPAIKIASFEITDIPLIRYAAGTGKPLILSTGMASDSEVSEAVRASRLTDRAVLHCVSGYPTPASEANLHRIHHYIIDHMAHVVGISDHSTGPEIPIAATALGACIIEKHFRLASHPDTEDSPFSLDGGQFLDMVRSVRNTWGAMQPSKFTAEDAHRPLRRSLFAVADIKEGEAFTEANVRSIRPGHGLPPIEIGMIVGRTATRDIARGEPMAWEMMA